MGFDKRKENNNEVAKIKHADARGKQGGLARLEQTKSTKHRMLQLDLEDDNLEKKK
jgi:hypothetical protein